MVLLRAVVVVVLRIVQTCPLPELPERFLSLGQRLQQPCRQVLLLAMRMAVLQTTCPLMLVLRKPLFLAVVVLLAVLAVQERFVSLGQGLKQPHHLVSVVLLQLLS